jgi:ABC-type branched-subunit amino acid transport system ATPase component/ABC-type branched-subunit amino acid transport system permease subunit
VSVPSFVLVQGVITGLSYGLLAMGLVLIYKTNRVLNFAQGQLGVVAAVFMVKCFYDFGFNYWFALVLSLLLAAAVGALSELLLRRLFSRPRVLVMVATIGLSQVLFVFTALPFIRPKNLFKPFPVPFDVSFHIGTYLFTPGQVMILVAAPLVAIGLAVLVKWSPWGLAMRAMAENADSARLSGVWVRRTSTTAWTVAGVLSAFTAILAAPGQTSSLTEVLSPELLLLALTAALVGAMVSLTVAFVAAIAVGVIQEILVWNLNSTAQVDLVLFAIVMVVLLVRIAALQTGSRREGSRAQMRNDGPLRRKVGATGVVAAVVGAALLPLVISVGNSFLLSQICIYAVIALSLTVLTGWAGQVSLGQFGLVACGALLASHLGSSLSLIPLMVLAGAVTAAIAVVVGLPALRVRGLYLAVSTLAFGLWFMGAVLETPCWTLPVLDKRLCTGLPNPQSTLIARPTLFGISLDSERAFAWFSLGLLVVSVLIVRLWRDRGVARRLIAVRDNETGAGAMGIPLARSKLLAFALSGFIAGYAGVCLAFATERFSTDTFDPTFSILVVSMVVIGGLGSIDGAVLGAIYLVGLPAIFGTTPTIQFLTSGLGLLAFILYLPGGLSELLHRLGDLATMGIERLSRRGEAEPVPAGTGPPPSEDGQRDGRTSTVEASADGPGPARLDMEAVAVAFGGVQAVDGADLSAEAGAIVGLIGPNGSGKTTMLDVISGLVSPQGGSVRLDGESLIEYMPEEHGTLGVVRSFQDCRLFPELSVEEVLWLTQDARRPVGVISSTLQMPWARRSEGEKRAAADNVIRAFGIDRFRRHPIAQLSTGTRRVVDLASIVLARPRLLLLDEPTAGIAQREAEAFVPLLRRLHQLADTTIILVEHDVPLVFALCTKVVMMETGRIVSTGTPEEVRRDPRALAAYLGASEEALAVSGAAAAPARGTGGTVTTTDE